MLKIEGWEYENNLLFCQDIYALLAGIEFVNIFREEFKNKVDRIQSETHAMVLELLGDNHALWHLHKLPIKLCDLAPLPFKKLIEWLHNFFFKYYFI